MKKEKIDYPFLNRPLTIYTLDNGHKVIVAFKEGKMMNISTWVKTGSINENDLNNGVSHFLEHLMFKGTHMFKAGEFDRILERKGGIINAATWKDYTFYYITISKTYTDLAIKMHSDMMTDPVVPEDEIGEAFDYKTQDPKQKRERYVVIEEIKMREDESWNKVYMATNDLMYEKHPYKREVIGTREIISSIKRADIMDYYNKFYTPDNMTTIVVGEFNEEEIIAKIASAFKFKNLKSADKNSFPLEIQVKKTQYTEQKSDVKTGYLMFGFLADSACNMKENMALDLISAIFGDGKSSRLNLKFIENVEEPHYYALSTSHYQFKDGDNFFIQANFNAKFKDKVIEELKEEIKNLKNITKAELEKAKKRLTVEFAENSETVSDIADTIGHYMTVCNDLSCASKFKEVLNEIDTEYLEKIARKYIDEKHCVISVLMPEEM